MTDHPDDRDASWTSACGDFSLHVPADVVREIERLCLEHYPNEIGTALYGSYSDDRATATVHGLAPIAEDSVSGAFGFVRGSAGLAKYFAQVWSESSGFVYYIGDWHSHPNGEPTPSTQDVTTARDIATDPGSQCAEVVQIIAAVNDGAVSLGAFVFSAKHGRVDLERRS